MSLSGPAVLPNDRSDEEENLLVGCVLFTNYVVDFPICCGYQRPIEYHEERSGSLDNALHFSRPADLSESHDVGLIQNGALVLVLHEPWPDSDERDGSEISRRFWRLAYLIMDYEHARNFEAFTYRLILANSRKHASWLRVKRHDPISGKSISWLDYSTSPTEYGARRSHQVPLTFAQDVEGPRKLEDLRFIDSSDLVYNFSPSYILRYRRLGDARYFSTTVDLSKRVVVERLKKNALVLVYIQEAKESWHPPQVNLAYHWRLGRLQCDYDIVHSSRFYYVKVQANDVHLREWLYAQRYDIESGLMLQWINYIDTDQVDGRPRGDRPSVVRGDCLRLVDTEDVDCQQDAVCGCCSEESWDDFHDDSYSSAVDRDDEAF